jgi:alpha-L-fucosidase
VPLYNESDPPGSIGKLSRRSFLAGSALALGWRHRIDPLTKPDRPVPTAAQLRWQREELAIFLHFGVNTFTDREWGDGTEQPSVFDPTALDARQWARVARSAGSGAMILTAKHHDGFCLWPTATTRHSVASSPWRGGTGDLVREFTDACKAEGLRAGLYLSPWDRNHPSYGDSPRYNDVYAAQLTELLTRYGPIHEVWFDGANGEGPNGRRQEYDWPRTWGLVRRLQPDAVIFSDAGPDIRWIGNERGVAGETNWSTVDPTIVPRPGMSGDEVMRSLTEGDPNGTVWRPGETDTSIRPGWFHHPAEDDRVRSVEDLTELYFTSVGRNSKLLLNVPPDRRGLLHETDISRLAGMRERLDDTFAEARRLVGSLAWQSTSESTGVAQLQAEAPQAVSVIDLREEITMGQRVARHLVEGLTPSGRWRELARGTTIGYRRLHRIDPLELRAIRVRVEESLDIPLPVTVSAWG